jgi:hypothetical protein
MPECVTARALPLPYAPLKRTDAAEALIDHRAHHGEDRDAGHPADGDIADSVGNPDAARHGGNKNKENHADRRAMFVFDADPAERPHTMLVAAEGIGADGFHLALPNVLELRVSQT